jgi:hypothetical protein
LYREIDATCNENYGMYYDWDRPGGCWFEMERKEKERKKERSIINKIQKKISEFVGNIVLEENKESENDEIWNEDNSFTSRCAYSTHIYSMLKEKEKQEKQDKKAK